MEKQVTACEVREQVLASLAAQRDEAYRRFMIRLLPTVSPDRILGVRVPVLRKMARQMAGSEQAAVFCRDLPHTTYEENTLHGFLIEQIRDARACEQALDVFLPCVDNWATCDMMAPRALGRALSQTSENIERRLTSSHPYTVRFAIGTRMRYFLGDAFEQRYLSSVAAVRSEEYYVRMMVAWFFATALARQYEATLPYLTEARLDDWVHNMTIRKACESRRIPEVQKQRLRALRRKES